MDLERLYDHRFQGQDKNPIWVEICRFFNSAYISEDDVVCDIGCGDGEFIRNIRAQTKYGVDLRKSKTLPTDVTLIEKSSLEITAADFTKGAPNVFFVSNFLEHLNSKEEIVALFKSISAVLRASGAKSKRLIIMGPNIDYVRERYWDFFDHKLPLNERSVIEGLVSCGYSIDASFDKFLPYSTKSSLPQHPFLVRTYLKVKAAWRLLGKQFLVVGSIKD